MCSGLATSECYFLFRLYVTSTTADLAVIFVIVIIVILTVAAFSGDVVVCIVVDAVIIIAKYRFYRLFFTQTNAQKQKDTGTIAEQ